ncbi:HD domain-containing protein [Cardinium endosymbiont of Tipula unca]|uniref:HD domain-containing protein n=1 Tax=Cardinium endosymbiont of Tipula unca TaxID=3066216 RepID=UPI0030CD62CF
MHLDLDIVVFALFLLINLFIGLNTTSRISTLRQYAVGSKGFTIPGIAASIITISYGGGVFYNPLNASFLLILTGSAISCFIIGNLLSHRLGLFLNNCSIAEAMGQLHGKHVRKIVAICGILNSAGATAIHLKALSMAISWLFEIDEVYSLCMAATFVVFSVGAGGVQSLTLVSIVRCATFVICLPTIAWILWKQLIGQHNADQLRLALTIKDSWHSLTSMNGSTSFCIFAAFAIPTFYPAQVQRILIAENATQIRSSFNYAGIFSLSINLFLLWIALLLNKTFGSLIISDIPSNIFQTYTGLKGLFVIGIAALTVSTASANLHASTVLIVNDLQDTFKSNKTPPMNIMQVRSYTAIVGLISTLLALCIHSPFQLLLLTNILFKPIVSIPLLISLMGFHIHRYAILIGMAITTGSMIYWGIFISRLDVTSLLPGMLINLLSICSAQLFLNRYTSKLDAESDYSFSATNLYPEATTKFTPLWTRFSEYLLPKIKSFNLLSYLQKQLPKNSSYYVLFSFYITVTGYCSFYTFSSNAIWGLKLEEMVLFPSLFVATFFLVYASVTPKPYSRKIISIAWELSNLYFFFLVGSCMLILSKFSHLQAIIFMVNISLSILVSSFTIILFRLIVTAIVIRKVLPYLGDSLELIDAFLNLNISVVYVILMLFIFLGGLLYHKENLRKLFLTIQELRSEQEEQNARQFFRKQQIEALAYESSYVLTQLHCQLLRLLKPENNALILPIQDQTSRLKKYFDGIFTHLKHNLYLATNWISTDQLLEECFDSIKISNIYHSPYVIINTEHLYIQCDIERIKTLIINSLHSCKLHENGDNNKRKDIYIYINDTQLGYRLTLLQGKIQKVCAISFMITTATQRPNILPIYKVIEMADVQVLNKAKEKEKIDAENQHIINAHYGYCEITHSDSEITHLYVIPINVQKITKAFAALSPVVYTQSVQLDPISIEEESIFLQKIKQIKNIDFENIKDVLELIKIYYTTQRRKTGELFYLHPMAVASILLDITQNSDLIIAGLSHDVVKNTPLTEAGLSTLLGEHITEIIITAELLEKKLPFEKDAYPTYIQSIVINDKNHPAILLRLADALHNAKTIHGHNIEKQVEKAMLVQKFYIPLAERMHLPGIASELNRYAAKVLDAVY